VAIQTQRGPKAALPSIHDTNLKLLTDASNLASDTGWLAPGAARLVTATLSAAAGGAGAVQVVSFPAGSAGSAGWALRPQPSWNSHLIVLRAVYKHASSTTPFGVTWTVNGVGVGQALAGTAIGTLTGALSNTPGDQLVATTEVTLSTAPILATMESLGILFTRNVDSQGDALLLLGIQYRVYHS
jgi:hypothetical protein